MFNFAGFHQFSPVRMQRVSFAQFFKMAIKVMHVFLVFAILLPNLTGLIALANSDPAQTATNNEQAAPTMTESARAGRIDEPAAYIPPKIHRPEPRLGTRPEASVNVTMQATNGLQAQEMRTITLTPSVPLTPMPDNQEEPEGESISSCQTFSNQWWCLNGFATITGPGAIRLTTKNNGQTSSAWNGTPIKLSEDFALDFIVYLGDQHLDEGELEAEIEADGIVFALQRAGTSALGGTGGSLGYSGIQPSIGVEIDTYPNPCVDPDPDPNNQNCAFPNERDPNDNDHMAIVKNGSLNHSNFPNQPFYDFGTVGEGGIDIEDDQEHWLRVTWEVDTHTLTVFWDGVQRLTYQSDLVQEIFGGNPEGIYYGFTGATEAFKNIQYFLPLSLPPDATHDPGKGYCLDASYANTQNFQGDPINTRRGDVSYTVTDLSMTTAAGPLTFERYYSSEAAMIGYYHNQLLGYGWTHNHDVRLYFDYYPHTLVVKGHTTNLFQFIQNPDGSYRPYPGVCASLIKLPDGKYNLVDKAQNNYLFDSEGKLVTWTNPTGQRLNYFYIGLGRLQKVSDDTGHYLEFTYATETSTQIKTVSDHTGRTVEFIYNNGRLVTARDVFLRDWTYEYTNANWPRLLTAIIDPAGKIVTRFEYAGSCNTSWVCKIYNGPNPEDLILELDYQWNNDTQGRDITLVTEYIDGQAYTRTDVYDMRKTLVSTTDAFSNKVYDRNFHPLEVTDSRGNTTYNTWSNAGNLEKVVEAKGGQTDMMYNASNNLTGLVDPRGYPTTYIYNGNLLTTVIDAYGKETHYTYWPGTNLLHTIEYPEGNLTQYAYDGYGQVISTTTTANTLNPLKETIYFDYDSLGRQLRITFSSGRTDWTCYDEAGRIIRTIQNTTGDPCDPAFVPSEDWAFDRITAYEYDVRGNRIAVRDRAQ